MILNNSTRFCHMSYLGFSDVKSLTLKRRHVMVAPSIATAPHCLSPSFKFTDDDSRPTLPTQVTGLFTSVCANSDNQLHLPFYLSAGLTCLINTPTFLPHLSAHIRPPLPATRVTTCTGVLLAVLQTCNSVCCGRHRNVAHFDVLSQ